MRDELSTGVTYGVVYDSFPAIRKLMDMPMPPRASLRLAVFAKKVQAEMEVFSEKHAELLAKFGDKNGDEYTLSPDNQRAFSVEFAEIRSETLKIDIPKITQADLGENNLPPIDLMALLWLIEPASEA